jgi:hypothetical protein
MAIPRSYPKEFDENLAATPGIQVKDPLVEKELRKIVPGREPKLLDALTRIHRHLQDRFANRDFAGYTDAVTALKLGEASCNGKSRLFAAMARKLNIPARLAGGLVMKQGAKRVSHQWVEVYANGHWVPFDTINDHFAELPAHYLRLYTGDLVLFKHTVNVNFQYFYKMTKRLVPRREAMEALGSSPLNIMNVYAVFERVGISQNLLKIILLLPLGALVTAVFRNVVGVQTFGTFLPALIAAAADGRLWARGWLTIPPPPQGPTDELLHSPKMAVVLTTVVITMLAITIIGVQFGLFELAHVTLFPIAILAITAERFALIETEQGFRKALKILLVTILVVAACYAVMVSLFLQSMILAFPELLLLITLNLWLEVDRHPSGILPLRVIFGGRDEGASSPYWPAGNEAVRDALGARHKPAQLGIHLPEQRPLHYPWPTTSLRRRIYWRRRACSCRRRIKSQPLLRTSSSKGPRAVSRFRGQTVARERRRRIIVVSGCEAGLESIGGTITRSTDFRSTSRTSSSASIPSILPTVRSSRRESSSTKR